MSEKSAFDSILNVRSGERRMRRIGRLQCDLRARVGAGAVQLSNLVAVPAIEARPRPGGGERLGSVRGVGAVCDLPSRTEESSWKLQVVEQLLGGAPTTGGLWRRCVR